MSLKKKLVLVLVISGCILALIFLVGFQFTLMPSLEEQKSTVAGKLKKKIQVALSIESDNIEIICSDWSNWDRLIDYLKKPTVDFERTALPDAMFTDRMIDMAAILNTKREILFYKNYRPGKGFIGLQKLDVRFCIGKVDRMIRGKLETVKGFINTPYGPIMFVANPILDRGNLNRREGVLIMGRYVDQRVLERFSSYTTEKIRTINFTKHQLVAFSLREMDGRDVHYMEKPEKLVVFQLLRDINGFPAMVLYTETDKRLYSEVSRHMVQFIVVTSILVMLLGLMLYFSIDKYIVKRVMGISGRMHRIEGLEDLSVRIDKDEREDEITLLISSINLTLDKLENEKKNREKAEKSMIKQGKLASLGRLASSIAHEINNPVLAIGNSLQVIKKICERSKEEGANDESRELLMEALDISDAEVHRIREIISGLLDFHRLDKEEFSNVNLSDVITQSIAILNWSKKLETVELELELEELYVEGAPVKLEQVFINFILNAAEAMGREGGTLTIAVTGSADGNCVEIHLKDTGPGLTPMVQGSLFEPFVTTKKDRGVGLGLYISYKIIEMHHGEIIYNEDFKEGAHFIIRLPLNSH